MVPSQFLKLKPLNFSENYENWLERVILIFWVIYLMVLATLLCLEINTDKIIVEIPAKILENRFKVKFKN